MHSGRSQKGRSRIVQAGIEAVLQALPLLGIARFHSVPQRPVLARGASGLIGEFVAQFEVVPVIGSAEAAARVLD